MRRQAIPIAKLGRDELPTTPSLRRGQVYKRASSNIEGAPKRSDSGLLIRVYVPDGLNLQLGILNGTPDEQELVPTEAKRFPSVRIASSESCQNRERGDRRRINRSFLRISDLGVQPGPTHIREVQLRPRERP